MFPDISVNSVDGFPGVSGERGTALLFYTIPRRLPPPSRVAETRLSSIMTMRGFGDTATQARKDLLRRLEQLPRDAYPSLIRTLT
jgi:hypothetical protein